MPQMEQLGIQGAALFTPHIHEDGRGSFLEWFRADVMASVIGRPLDLAQANCSVSARGALRGVHFSDVPPGQAKYITCVRGAILDVVVDLRVGSPAFGRWEIVRLDDEKRQALYIAEGLGHAFLSLADDTTVIYLCSSSYSPGRDHEVNPLDPAIGIEWPTNITPQLSPKDKAAPTLAQALEAGLLPDYQ
jgi:dTDP-4-dehydrorhamnose 3,5-epimerase